MRLFTAICFEEETKNALFNASEKVKSLAKGNFTAKENFHLTLVFIGETDRREDIKKALSKIEFPSFSYKFRGFGTFEKGIFWAGIEENENLEKLHRVIKSELSAIGTETEERKFMPHITIARKFCPAENFDFSAAEKLLPKKEQKAAKISLMKSERVDGVLCYTEIWSKDLT